MEVGSPPPGGTTETQPPERPGHGRPVQPSGSGEGPPWPPGGAGGGGSPQPPEGSGRPPRHSGGGGGTPPPGGNGNGNGNGGREVDNLPLEEVGMVEVMTVMVMEMEEVTLLHPLI